MCKCDLRRETSNCITSTEGRISEVTSGDDEVSNITTYISNTFRKILPRHILQSYREERHISTLIRGGKISLTDTNIRNMARRLKRLRGRYSNQRCFIMGNGPSLNQMDLSLFRNEFLWGTNKCYLLYDRISWRPTFYSAVDTRVVPDIANDIIKLISNYPETLFFFPVLFRMQGLIKSHPNVYWYYEQRLDEARLPDGMFSQDADNFVYAARTVSIAALQLAVYLGFNPIYLIGCDTSYTIPTTVQNEGNDENRLISTADDDISHFDPRYFGNKSKWHAPHVERMIFHYQQSKLFCDAVGVKVYNATVGGKLEVFPRINYLELFS